MPEDCDLLAVGEMGIANTTAAATLCAALLGGGAARWAGRGTGVDDDGLARKRAADRGGTEFPSRHSRRSAGGGGSAWRPRTRGDRRRACSPRGSTRFRCCSTASSATSAVLPLARLDPGALDHCRAGHVSAEAGHRDLLRELKLDPLLDLNMRLGEASGAGTAILLARAALACHAGMATFAEAGVSGADD